MKIKKKAQFSNMLLLLPSTLDRKENFLKWKDHVHLHPIDFHFDDLKEITGIKEMNPSLLNNKDLRGEVTGAYYKLMKKIAEISNQNLVRNSDACISTGGNIDPDNEFSWCDDSYKSSKGKFHSIKLLNLGSSSNILPYILEELQMKFLMYLGTEDLITLCYVSKCIRDLVLRNFNQIFRISTGFCSVEHWSSLIKKILF